MNTFRLILWPTLITAAVSTARLIAEVQGIVPPQSGGALNPLGISWLAIVFGAWFGFRLRRNGSHPRVPRAALWGILAFVALAGSIVWQFAPLRDLPANEETFAQVRTAVVTLIAIAGTLAIAMFVVWPRLAWTMLCYAIPARLLVIGFTWLAKQQQWDTHYTKFGPSGIERDMHDTVVGASIAQGGFWVSYTIIAGFLIGGFFGKRR